MENDSVGNFGHWSLMLKWHAVRRNWWKNQRCEDYYNKDPILQCKNCYNTSKKLITSFVAIGQCIYDLHTSWQHHFKSPQQATIFFNHVRPSDKKHKYHCWFTNNAWSRGSVRIAIILYILISACLYWFLCCYYHTYLN